MGERPSSGELASERLYAILSDPEAIAALEKLVRVAVKLDKSGILDLAESLAEGRLIRDLLELALSEGTLDLLDKLEEVVKELGDVADSFLEEPKPLGLTGLLGALRDPEVQRGLGRLVRLLKALGRLRLSPQ